VLMQGRRIVLAAAAALISAGAAHAADSRPADPRPAENRGVDLTVRSETVPVASSAMKSLKWDARKGRWGVTLNMDQPDARPSTLNDVQAGAYYRITPSLRVGGAVALGEEQVSPGPKKIGSEETRPRVRLESSFKF
jgi:hypothetical protein